MSEIVEIKFNNYNFISANSDGIDSDRYIIPFSIIYHKDKPKADEISHHSITVSVAGSILATKRLWNFKESEVEKVIYTHACEFIKSLILDNTVSENLKLDLTEKRLSRYNLDPNKIPEISDFNCILDLSQKKKVFGFRP